VFLAVGPATSDLTGKACFAQHRPLDLRHLGFGQRHGQCPRQAGGDTWFFLTADYAFGHALERDTEAVVLKSGGRFREGASHSQGRTFVIPLQAQSSKAKVIGLANAGGDTINAIKQASEFGIVQGGQKLAGLLIFLTDVHSLGLKTAQGLVFTAPCTGIRTTPTAPSEEYLAANSAWRHIRSWGLLRRHSLPARVRSPGSHGDARPSALLAREVFLPEGALCRSDPSNQGAVKTSPLCRLQSE